MGTENFGKKTRIEELDYDLITKSYIVDVDKFSSRFLAKVGGVTDLAELREANRKHERWSLVPIYGLLGVVFTTGVLIIMFYTGVEYKFRSKILKSSYPYYLRNYWSMWKAPVQRVAD